MLLHTHIDRIGPRKASVGAQRSAGLQPMRMLLHILAVALLLSGSTAWAAGQMHSESEYGEKRGTGALTEQERQFVIEAAKGNQGEQELGKLAQRKAQNPAVRQYGEQLAQGHTQANEKLRSIARANGIRWPDQPKEEQRELIDSLQSMQGREFDDKFLSEVEKQHKQTLDKYKEMSREASDPQLRQYVQNTIPALQRHLEMARNTSGRDSMRQQIGMTGQRDTGTVDPGELQNARETAGEAAQVVQQIKRTEARDLVQQAQAVFIVPDYARASLGIGGAGGQGVLMVNRQGRWVGPAFYNIGSLSLGLQAGVEVGSVAFFIMSDQAMTGFRDDNNFSLNADAGLTVVDFSQRAQASAGKGADVVVWADTEGLHGNLSVSVANIFRDEEANNAYYGQADVDYLVIIQGEVELPVEQSPLRSEFSAFETREQPSGSRSPGSNY